MVDIYYAMWVGFGGLASEGEQKSPNYINLIGFGFYFWSSKFE